MLCLIRNHVETNNMTPNLSYWDLLSKILPKAL